MKNAEKIVMRDIEEIKPYENNPRFNENAIEKVANSIKEFGFTQPIILDKNDVIICGHTRREAALQLGIKSVPTITADWLNSKQVKALRLADNKVAELATWDYDLLDAELEGLFDIDMSDFGFEEFEQELDGDFQRQFKEFGDGETKKYFDITLTFDAQYENDVLEYIKGIGGRRSLEKEIIERATGGESNA